MKSVTIRDVNYGLCKKPLSIRLAAIGLMAGVSLQISEPAGGMRPSCRGIITLVMAPVRAGAFHRILHNIAHYCNLEHCRTVLRPRLHWDIVQFCNQGLPKICKNSTQHAKE